MMQVPQSQWKPYLGLLSAQEEDIVHDPRGELINYFKGGFSRGPCRSIMRGEMPSRFLDPLIERNEAREAMA